MAPFNSPHPPVPFPDESYAAFLLKDAYSPDTAAYIDGITGEAVTRREQKAQAMSLARGLRNAERVGLLPLHKGSGVIVYSPNSLLYPVVMMAMGVAGLRPAYANSNYVVPELVHAFKISDSTHIMVAPSLLETSVSALASIGYSRDEAKHRIIIMARRNQIPADAQQEGWKGVDDLLPTESVVLPEPFDGAAAQETAAIFFSSGTTGLNKAIMLSHRNIVSVLAIMAARVTHYQYKRDVLLGVAPMYHIMGANVVTLLAWARGVPVVVLPRFEPESFIKAISRFKVTNAALVPPLLTFLARTPLVDKYDLSSLRNVSAGAAPVIRAMFDRVVERLAKQGANIECGCGYGLTETSGIAARIAGADFDRHRDSVGALYSNLEGRLVGSDGEDVPEGQPGELWVRGPSIAKGYYNNPQANAETYTPDGWLKTGDIAVRNAESMLSIVDRKKELVKYKGFQVAPAELESVLSDHPGVEDSGVVGIYSEEEATELPRACIVPRDRSTLRDREKGNALSQDIHAWLKPRVANFKLLRGGIVYVEAIPRTASGKIMRKDLRKVDNTHVARAKL